MFGETFKGDSKEVQSVFQKDVLKVLKIVPGVFQENFIKSFKSVSRIFQ